jgi:hypothetical protein
VVIFGELKNKNKIVIKYIFSKYFAKLVKIHKKKTFGEWNGLHEIIIF